MGGVEKCMPIPVSAGYTRKRKELVIMAHKQVEVGPAGKKMKI